MADFSEGDEVYKHIEKKISGIPIGILGKSISMIVNKLIIHSVKEKSKKIIDK